ncbi:hypothetical protein KJ611_01045 [Patescibacteria group bacterium]|nr:hypothetical protein [Patescibacteria group bacterium]MBU1705272.1 hypothetical protein [Patescibacteria group bacterium]
MSSFIFISLAMFTLWVFVLLLSEETRKEQLVMSVIGLVLSPAILLMAANNERNWAGLMSLGYEDFLFSFAMFGIAAVIYQAATGRQAKPIKRRRRKLKNRALHWLAHLLIISGLWLLMSLLANLIFALNPFQAFMVGGLLIGLYIVADRRDLMINAVFSGLFIAILIFALEKVFLLKLFPEATQGFMNLGQAAGPTLAGVPLAEIFWAAIVGFTVGPLYEYVRYLRLK